MLEGAFLAGLPKGPSYYDPDRHPKRAQERFTYVLARLRADDVIDTDTMRAALSDPPKLVAYVRPRRDTGHHFVDNLVRETKALPGFENLTSESFTVHSTINVPLQRAAESALQEGLARYEMGAGRAEFAGPELSLAETVKRIEKRGGESEKPVWQRALENASLPLYDVHWTPAIVVEQTEQQPAKGKKAASQSLKVGLSDGRILPLSAWNSRALRTLSPYDVVYVHVNEGTKKSGPRAELRTRPTVQGATIVLENKTGRVLAMAGSFSYPLSQLNRTTQSARQPGSSLKPLTYLATLANGLQPNTLVRDTPLTLPPIGGTSFARPEDYWSPKNYDGSSYGQLTLRRALENSRNLATAHLLEGGIADTPERSLDRLCDFAKEAKVYTNCMPYYPFVLGAQPVRPIDLAAFYATIANEGARPVPHLIESIERRGEVLYKRDDLATTPFKLADNVAFAQLKSMMQGVVARGTAARMSALSPYIAGKTGTSEEENDVWFAGFSNEVTVVVWVGYDNADGKRRTLGSGRTGGNLAVPIFEPIMKAAWEFQAPRTALRPPSREAMKKISVLRIDLHSGDVVQNGGMAEYFRVSRSGQVDDTRYLLVSRGGTYDDQPEPYYEDDPRGRGNFFSSFDPRRIFSIDRPLFQTVPPQQQVPQQQVPQAPAQPRARYYWDRERGIQPDNGPQVRNEAPEVYAPRYQAPPQPRGYYPAQPQPQQRGYYPQQGYNAPPQPRPYYQQPERGDFGFRRF